MKTKFVIATVVALSVGLIVTNCKKEVKTIEPQNKNLIHENENGRIEIFENVKPITVDDAKKLIAVSDDKLTFQGENDFFNSIRVGDVLVSPNTELTPDGYIKIVNSIEKNGDKYIFLTSNSTLDKVINNGSIHYDFPIMFPEDTSDFHPNNKVASDFALTKTFNYPLNYVLYDYDGNKTSTTYDQIKTNGALTLTANMALDLTFSGGTLQYLDVKTPLTAVNSQTLTLGGTINIPQKSYKIVSVTTIPSAGFFVGVVYVSIKPTVDVYVDFGGSVNAYAKFGYKGSATVTPQIKFQGGVWKTYAPLTKSLVAYKPTANVSATFNASLRPRITFSLYGCTKCASAYIEGSVYGKLKASLVPTVSKSMTGGIAASVGATLFGYSKSYNNFVNYQFPIF